jgi:hypothetical protein
MRIDYVTFESPEGLEIVYQHCKQTGMFGSEYAEVFIASPIELGVVYYARD